MLSVVFYLIVALMCFAMGFASCIVFYEKGLAKSQQLARKIGALSEESQKLVGDYVHARTVRDDQKYSKFKKRK